VKKLSSITDDTSEKQFQQELNLTKVKQKNIVRILGYCFGTSPQVVSYNGERILAGNLHRFLCLEYIPNKSLKEYLEGMTSIPCAGILSSTISYLYS
jgi:serine/threonine protein kinase